MQISASAIFALLLVSLLLQHVSADDSDSGDCEQVIVGLAPCLQYIQGNATSPSSGCCTQLATIVKTRPRCVCHVFSGVNVNQTLALALPKACDVHITTPSLTLCEASSPAGSPLPSATPSGERSRTSQSEDSSGGCSLKLPYSLYFTLVIAAFSMFNTML